jgi:hypothetical protein
MKWIIFITLCVLLYFFIRRKRIKYDKSELIDNIADLLE